MHRERDRESETVHRNVQRTGDCTENGTEKGRLHTEGEIAHREIAQRTGQRKGHCTD